MGGNGKSGEMGNQDDRRAEDVNVTVRFRVRVNLKHIALIIVSLC
jgi:hypothetical protein